MEIRVIIVDDERLARENLRNKLKGYNYINIISEASSVSEGLQKLEEYNPDVLFLDIQLGDGTGFDLVNKTLYKGKIVFVTAFDEYAIRAFRINALDYLVKPISEEYLDQTIQRIIEDKEETKKEENHTLQIDDRIILTSGVHARFVQIQEIVMIASAKDYTEVYIQGGKKYLINRSMSKWEKQLPVKSFCRIHRSNIINLDHIEKMVKYATRSMTIFMKDIPDPITVSRNYYSKIRKLYS